MKLFSNRFVRLMNDAAGGDAGGGGAAPAAAPVVTPAVVDPAPPAAVPVTPLAGPTGFVNPDGTFVQDWHKHEQFKDTPGMDKFKDFPTLVKSYKALESKLGAPPAAPGPPAADAAPEVLASYREAHGIPATPDAYQLKPETIPDGVIWSDDMAKKFGDIFHKNNIPAPVAKAIAAEQVAYEAETARRAVEALKSQQDSDQAALRQEWGGAYDQKLAGIKSVVTALGYDPQDQALFNNAKVIGFLGKVVGQLSPDSVAALGVSVDKGGKFMSPSDEYKAITTDTSHPDYARYYAGEPSVVDKVRRLAGQIPPA